MAAMLVSPGPILSYPFQKLLLSRPQSSHSVTVRGNKMTTSKECLMLFYYLSLCSIVDICLPFWSEWERAKGWHFLDVIARGAPFE